MTANTTKKAAGAINTNGLHADTNAMDFLTGDAMGQARDDRVPATRIANSSFLDRKLGMAQLAKDFDFLLGGGAIKEFNHSVNVWRIQVAHDGLAIARVVSGRAGI